MTKENKVEVTLCLTDGTKLTRVENIADITTFLEQHEEYVKVKHGQWIEDEYGIPHCSNCGTINNTVYRNYCPNCGARMDEVEE